MLYVVVTEQTERSDRLGARGGHSRFHAPAFCISAAVFVLMAGGFASDAAAQTSIAELFRKARAGRTAEQLNKEERQSKSADTQNATPAAEVQSESAASNDALDTTPPDAVDATPNESTNAQNADAPAKQQHEVEQYVRVGVDNRVTMHVADLPLAEAMRMISEPTQRNIILAKGVTGTVTATLYDVTFEAALEAMLISNGLGYRTQGAFIFVFPLEDLERFREAERKIETRVFRLSYVRANDLKSLIEPLKSRIGKIAFTPASNVGLGGSTGPTDTHGDAHSGVEMIIATDYEDVLDDMEDLIRKVDVRPDQVLIEATLLRATLTEQNALGIDFTTVGGIDFTELNSTSPAAQSITTGLTPPNKLMETTLTARTDFNANVPNGGFTFGIIKDQIGAFVRALETITDIDIIANPKVLALNKQFGQVIVGRRDGYLTTTITETTAVQTVEFLETGTILTFRPFIGNDGYVRMEIHPKDSTGGLSAANLPFEQTTEVTTNVMVKDGHTILIGGLFREVTTSNRSQVPGLGNLPGLGALFRSTDDSTVREEVIVLLTVRIIKPEVDTKASDELNEDIERIRVGMRKGVQWFGRERLAQAHYNWALEHLSRGDVGRALWDAEIARITFPRHVEAFKLSEQLKGQRTWETEASTIRSWVRDQILKDHGIELPPFGRPAPPFIIPTIEDMEGGEIDMDANPPADEGSDEAASVRKEATRE